MSTARVILPATSATYRGRLPIMPAHPEIIARHHASFETARVSYPQPKPRRKKATTRAVAEQPATTNAVWRRMEATVKREALENEFLTALHDAGLPEPVRQLRFHKPRRFAFDFAWPSQHLAAEAEGGTWQGGRHVTGTGYEGDCLKYNLAVLDGWRVLRFTAGMIHDRDGYAVATIRQALEQPGAPG